MKNKENNDLVRQIDNLIRQLPFPEDITYRKITKYDRERERKESERVSSIIHRNAPGSLCRWCNEMNGKGGVPCSCHDL